MPSVEITPRGPATLVLLACLAGVLVSSLPGCSPGGGPTDSAAGKDTMKATFKKKFQDSGEEKAIKGRR